MTKNEIGEFTTMWLSIAELTKVQLSENAVALACDILRDYSLESIKTACRRHLSDSMTGRYMPKPVQIMERINAAKKRKESYKAIEHEERTVRNTVARNECMYHIKKMLPNLKLIDEENNDVG